jgi:hypothetical protein
VAQRNGRKIVKALNEPSKMITSFAQCGREVDQDAQPRGSR